MADKKIELQASFQPANRFTNYGDAILRLHIKGFRNHSNTPIAIESPVTAFCGVNGTGKSTILQLAAAAYKAPAAGGRYYVSTFILAGTMDKKPFADNASFEVSYAQPTLPDGKIPTRDLTVSRADSKWSGYDHQPERRVAYLGVGFHMPHSERDEDYKSKVQDTRLELRHQTAIEKTVLEKISTILLCNYDVAHQNTLRRKYARKSVALLSAKRQNGEEYSEANMGCTFTRILSSKKTQEKMEREIGSELAPVVTSLLALAVGRLNDRLCSLCRWRPDKNSVEAANGGQNKMPMLLDFAESTPFGGSSGDWTDHIEWITRVLEHITKSRITAGTVQQGPAQTSILPDDSASALVTDPPYFDAFGYSDLSEFFHIWLRRTVPRGVIDMTLANVPKQEEAISIGKALSDGRGLKNASTYSEEMRRAFKAARHTVSPNGIGVVVFANKTTAGWEAILDGLINAGWIATASWPIDTELANRQRAIGSAALNSSVHIVCRPRENPDGSVRTDEIGDWRDVLGELPGRIRLWMQRLLSEGVVGADAIFACLGPALEIFSRYSRVEKADGEQVFLGEFLEQVWATVSREALATIFDGADASGLEADARLTAMWLWTLNASNTDNTKGDSTEEDEVDESDGGGKNSKATGFVLEYDAARKIAQGLGANLEVLRSLVEISGDKARLLPVAERAQHLFGKGEGKVSAARKKKTPQLDLFKVLEQADDSGTTFGETLVESHGATVLDRIHQSMILFAAGRSEAMKRFLVEDGAGRDPRFWRLAQALSALYPASTEEKRWVDGVLARKKGLGF